MAVEGVRVVRDQATSVGKGIAYVCFKEKSGVSIALQMNDTMSPAGGSGKLDTTKDPKHKPRKMRVTTCVRKLK